MDKNELKSLVMKYFNLQPNTTENITDKVKENFVEATLEDGTKIHAEGEAFEVGQTLHVVTSEGEYVTAPSGMHTTDSGIVLTVSEEGIITGIHHPDQEGEGSLEASVEEMSAEEVSEGKTEMAEHEEEEVMEEESDIKSDIIEAIAEVVAPQLEELKVKLAELESKMNDTFASVPASAPTVESKFNKQKKDSLDFLNTKFDFKKAQLDSILSRTNK